MKVKRSLSVILVMGLLTACLAAGTVKADNPAYTLQDAEYLASENYGGFATNNTSYVTGTDTTYWQSVTDIQADGYFNKSQPYASWVVNADTAGEYYFQIKYEGTTTACGMSVNDKAYVTSYTEISDNGNWLLFCLPLDAGRNVIRFLPYATAAEGTCDVYCMKADSRVSVIEEEVLTLYPSNSEYIYKWTDKGDNQGVGGTGSVVGDASYRSINYFNYGKDYIPYMPSVSYTLDVQKTGYYDIDLNYSMNPSKVSSCYVIVRVDGVNYMRGFDSYGTNKLNASVYLTEGTHTLTFTAAVYEVAENKESGYPSWFDVNTISVYGGASLAATQIEPTTYEDATRLEAETDGIEWRYGKKTESGKSKTVVGNIENDHTAQSFANMSTEKWIEKSNLPMVSYIVNVPTAGTYTLRSVYRISPNTDQSVLDYFMTVAVNDVDFYKAYFTPAVACAAQWAASEVEVELKAGYNVVRMISVVEETDAIVNWLNQDYVEVYGGPAVVSAVAPNVTHLQSGEADYYRNYNSVVTGIVSDWATTYLGNYCGNNTTGKMGVTYDTLVETDLNDMKHLGYFSYTIDVPADGYYDLQTYYEMAKACTGYLVLIDFDANGTPSIYKMNASQTSTSSRFNRNAQNLTIYMEQGTHTLVVSGILGTDATDTTYTDWCDIGALTVTGGITKSATQIDPLSLVGFDVPEKGLVNGSALEVDENNIISNVSRDTTVLSLKSNFYNNEDIVVKDAQGTTLSDSDIVPCGAQVIYSDNTTYVVADAFLGDLNKDGKIDIRDLKIAKEYTFGETTGVEAALGDISGSDDAITADDVTEYRKLIFGEECEAIKYQTGSIGSDVILEDGNPVGRLLKYKDAVFMESSASNFTLTGDISGNVYLNLYADQIKTDELGIFVEVDGVMSYHRIDTRYEMVELLIAENLTAGEHTIKVSKSTDAKNDDLYIYSVRYNGSLEKTEGAAHKMVFLGDSITAAYGVFSASDENYDTYGETHSYFGYANRTADKLNADYYSVANGGWVLCETLKPDTAIKAIYDKTSMHSWNGLEDDTYDFSWNPEVVVINLGTNDREDATEADITANAAALLALVREKNPNAAIFWAYGAMDADADNVAWIKSAVEAFAQTDGNTYYVELPENTAGRSLHPDEEGHEAIAEVLSAKIAEVMNWTIAE